ncbi:MAG: hypothetical protein EHM61_13805 [Acidobacteria bacterium]|nr:MAG: hypothetical protein EHM61_13805 [Acidobacteriota bacterium]
MDAVQREPAMPPQSVPEVRQVTVSNSSFAGRSIRDLQLREKYGVTVVAIRRTRGESLVNPAAATVLELGDKLRVLGRSDEIDTFTQLVAAQDPVLSQTPGS